MSAYIVSREHVVYLVLAAERLSDSHEPISERHHAIEPELWAAHATAIAQELWNENIKGFSYRYEGRHSKGLSDCIIKAADLNKRFRFNPVQILKAIQCFDYQCEHPEWESSHACTWLRRLASAAISELPGYDEAEWGQPEEETQDQQTEGSY